MIKKNKILIFGVYGHGNVGDEAILQSMTDIFKKKFNSEIEVIGMERKYVEVFNRLKMYYPIPNTIKGCLFKAISGELLKTLKALKKCDIFIMGGGGFLSDAYSDVPFGYLKHAFIAKIFGKKTMLYGIGAGQFLSKKGRFWTKYFINNYIDRVTVRDKISEEWLLKCGVKKNKIFVTGDQAINLETQMEYEKIKLNLPRDKKNIAIIPIEYLKNRNPEKFVELESAFLNYLNRLEQTNEYNITLIPFLDTDDLEFCNTLVKKSGVKAEVLPIPGHHLLINNVLKEYDLIVSMRLHGNIIAAANNKLFIPIIYHYKGFGFIENLDWNYFVEFGEGKNWKETDLDVDKLYNYTVRLLSNQKKYEMELLKKVELYKQREKQNIKILKELLEEK